MNQTIDLNNEVHDARIIRLLSGGDLAIWRCSCGFEGKAWATMTDLSAEVANQQYRQHLSEVA